MQSAKRFEYLANKFDPSTVIDQGLFNQMSITELKERLIQMRRLEQEALEQKRKEIET